MAPAAPWWPDDPAGPQWQGSGRAAAYSEHCLRIGLRCPGGASRPLVVGEVAEWSKANDSKSFEGKPSVGSNPTLSVRRDRSRRFCNPFSSVARSLAAPGFDAARWPSSVSTRSCRRAVTPPCVASQTTLLAEGRPTGSSADRGLALTGQLRRRCWLQQRGDAADPKQQKGEGAQQGQQPQSQATAWVHQRLVLPDLDRGWAMGRTASFRHQRGFRLSPRYGSGRIFSSA